MLIYYPKIQADIAKKTLFKISAGQSRGKSYHSVDASLLSQPSESSLQERAVNVQLPAVLQVRLVSMKGLFKGCLIVCPETALCRSGCVIMRKSMLKANCHDVYGEKEDAVQLDIVSTFEKTDDSCSHHATSSAYLNRNAVLLLSYLGAAKHRFEKLLRYPLARKHVIASSILICELQ